MRASFRLAVSAAVLALAAGIVPAAAGSTPSPPGARVYFIDLADGATVKSPLTLRFGLSGMGVAPAGVEKEATGHHHLLIDAPLTAADLAEPLPADAHHVHFGKGQTEATITLTPGHHTLQLVLGDNNHIPHAPPVTSAVVNVTVAP